MAADKTVTRVPVMKTYKLYIGGAFPRTESGRYMQIEGDKGEFLANVCRGSRKDFRNAVVAARKAQSGWAARSAFNRGQILYRMAEMLESRAAGFERLLVDVAGYKAADAKREVEVSVDRLIYYAGWSDKFQQVFGCTNPVASPHFNFTFPEATGVVASLTSTTAPLLGLISAMAPLIVSGNTCVLVVDNDAPMVSIDFAEVLHNSDLPGGVVNIITGLREELDPHVSGHMDVDGLLGFGVSDADRKTLQTAGAENIKRVKFLPDYKRADWQDEARQTPYWILPFVEFKTAWHPMGN